MFTPHSPTSRTRWARPTDESGDAATFRAATAELDRGPLIDAAIIAGFGVAARLGFPLVCLVAGLPADQVRYGTTPVMWGGFAFAAVLSWPYLVARAARARARDRVAGWSRARRAAARAHACGHCLTDTHPRTIRPAAGDHDAA